MLGKESNVTQNSSSNIISTCGGGHSKIIFTVPTLDFHRLIPKCGWSCSVCKESILCNLKPSFSRVENIQHAQNLYWPSNQLVGWHLRLWSHSNMKRSLKMCIVYAIVYEWIHCLRMANIKEQLYWWCLWNILELWYQHISNLHYRFLH